jgi:hypothetical protein
VKVEDFGFANYGNTDVKEDPDIACIEKNQVYMRETMNSYLAKDLKFGEIYAQAFSPGYNHNNDLYLSKQDLVFDSHILSDYHIVSTTLTDTAVLHSALNGIALFTCGLIYALLTNEFKSLDFITALENSRLGFFQGSTSLIILYLIALGCFQINFVSAYNISFNLGKPGQAAKLKQLMVLVGAPLFTCLFLIPYLNGGGVSLGVKLILEILIIISAYVELNEVEREAKEQTEKKNVLSKILPLAHPNKGAFNEYWATLGRAEVITREVGVEELKRIAIDAII